MNYLSSFLTSLFPVVFAILLELLFTRVKFIRKIIKNVKIYYWFEIALVGVVFSVLICLSYYFGSYFKINNSNFNLLGTGMIPLLIAFFCFDYKSGIMVGITGFFFRFFINFPSYDIFRNAVSSIILIVTVCSVFTKIFLFKNKRPKWVYTFFVGIFAETIQMFFVLLFNVSSISAIVEAIETYDIFAILITSIFLALASLFLALLNKEKIRLEIVKNKKLTVKVQKWLGAAIILSFILSFTISYVVNYQKAFEEDKTTLVNAVDDAYKQAEEYHTREDMEKLATQRRVMLNGFFIVTDDDNEIISIHSDHSEHLTDYFAIQVGVKSYEIRDYDSGVTFRGVWNNTNYLICYMTTDDSNYNVIGLIPFSDVIVSAGVAVRVVIYLLIIIFCVLFVLVDSVINRMIVHSIYRVNTSLRKITAGDLNEEVKVIDSEEFAQLSNDINLTVESLKNYTAEVERRMEIEKEIARNIQKGSVPTSFPHEKYYDIHALMIPAKEVGGDFYDFIKLSDDRVAFLIADISGKGIPAAMFMMRAKTYIKSLLSIDTPIRDLVAQTNKELCQQNPLHMFLAAWIGMIDLKSGMLVYVNAGHIEPLIRQNGEYKVLNGEKNLVLGVEYDAEYKVSSVVLRPGDDIFLYTDGVVNIKNHINKINYGVPRLIDLVNKTQLFNAKQLVQCVSDDTAKFSGGLDLADDLTFLSFKYIGAKEGKAEHEITLKAIPNNTPIATKFVESIMQQYNCSAKSQAVMLIAVDELFSNIAYYAYKDQPKPGNGTIQIKIKGQEFYLILIDQGKPFDPLSHLDPNYINASAEERTNKGGLGLFMVRRSVDDMTYRYENGNNILTIKKIIPEMKEEVFKDSYSTTRD